MYGFGRTDPALFTRLTGMTVERLPAGSLDLTMGGGLPVAGRWTPGSAPGGR